MVNYDNRNTARYLTTMASKLTSSFGYEYNFVSKPDDDLKCFICLAVARDPWQHGKCGSLFCEKCLNKHGKEKPCPECGKGPQYMEDSRGKCSLAGQTFLRTEGEGEGRERSGNY